MKIWTTVASALLGLALATAAHAVPVTLSSLLSGQTASIIAGDKQFDRFAVTNYINTTGQTALNSSNITVEGINLNPLAPGLDFVVLNNELDAQGVNGFLDVTLRFRVTVLDPMMAITGTTLGLSGGISNASGIVDAGMYILETLGSSAGGNDIGELEVELASPSTPGIPVSASLGFGAVSELWVTKNILVFATGAGDFATLSRFTQRFEQGTRTVPEPVSLALVALALGAAGLSGRRGRVGTTDRR